MLGISNICARPLCAAYATLYFVQDMQEQLGNRAHVEYKQLYITESKCSKRGSRRGLTTSFLHLDFSVLCEATETVVYALCIHHLQRLLKTGGSNMVFGYFQPGFLLSSAKNIDIEGKRCQFSDEVSARRGAQPTVHTIIHCT